ncbi:hypothetical protein [Kozakia baliensis]|uniref:hypothetical protein n=1 Tax=Kozakia baliensis TaxID=153496 RepID=UPI001244A8F0|nr:hypothetical protein [Kozakia baliensis]
MFLMLAPLATVDRTIVPWIENETVGPFASALKNCVRRSLYNAYRHSFSVQDADCPYRAWCAALDTLVFKLKYGSREEKKVIIAFLKDVEDFLPAELDSDPPANWPRLPKKLKKLRAVA